MPVDDPGLMMVNSHYPDFLRRVQSDCPVRASLNFNLNFFTAEFLGRENPITLLGD
jgi:hypothetical protein